MRDELSGGPFVWQPPGHPVRVIVRRRAAERMRRHAVRSEAGKGRDSGGLLRGSIERGGEAVTVTVEDVEPLSWSFSLSPSDRRDLESAIKGTGAASEWAVVGYYRTQTRDHNLMLNSGDVTLIRMCFPDPANVFLLLKPGEDRNIASRLFFWQGGVMQSIEGSGGFPFGRPGVEGTAAPAGQSQASDLSPGSPPPLEKAPRLRLRPRALWIPAGAAAIALALLFGPSLWRSSESEEPASRPLAAARQLGLEVDRRPGDLVVRWNGEAPAIGEAESAVLHVQDGQQRRSYKLDPDQMRTGVVYYAPQGADVNLRLEVRRGGGEPLVESVRVLSPGVLAASAKPPAVSRAPRAGAGSASRSSAAARTARSEVRIPFDPAPRPRTVHYHYLDRSPASPEERAAGSASPRPLRQVDPTVPQNLRASLKGDVELGVRVQIDHTGRVTSARVVSKKGPATSLLSDSAVTAARLWLFEPAMRGGRPVPSDTVLSFRFP
jgi:TonB family protein